MSKDKPIVKCKVDRPTIRIGKQIHAIVLNHPRFEPNTFVRTSPIIAIDRDSQNEVLQFETFNTIYRVTGDLS